MLEKHDRAAIEALLDGFHTAAAAADEARYLAALAPAAVFLGTAPGERWAGAAFRAFVHEHFSRGQGWTYTPRERTVDISPGCSAAWFDETLSNDHYGECRGSGVLLRIGHEWHIAQYNLTIPVPDAIAPEVVARIREVS